MFVLMLAYSKPHNTIEFQNRSSICFDVYAGDILINTFLAFYMGLWAIFTDYLTCKLRIDYCDERVIQESSYISGAIPLTYTYYLSYEGQYFSVLDHTSNI